MTVRFDFGNMMASRVEGGIDAQHLGAELAERFTTAHGVVQRPSVEIQLAEESKPWENDPDGGSFGSWLRRQREVREISLREISQASKRSIAEQIRRLKALGIPYTIVPGVPAFAAAAASMGQELTAPELAQTIIVTRTAMQSSSMPPGEDLATLGASGATLAIHLSIRNLLAIERDLTPHYGADCPVAVIYRVGWPDEVILRGTLSDIHAKVRAAKITRTALILVGPALSGSHGFPDSALYDATKPHVLRPKLKV